MQAFERAGVAARKDPELMIVAGALRRRRIARPAMIIDMPGRALEEHSKSIAGRLSHALQAFKSGELPGSQRALEEFLGYR